MLTFGTEPPVEVQIETWIGVLPVDPACPVKACPAIILGRFPNDVTFTAGANELFVAASDSVRLNVTEAFAVLAATMLLFTLPTV
jgi:hypothetical protein